MTKGLKRISALVAVIFTFQFYCPVSDNAYAGVTGSRLLENRSQSKLNIEFQAFPVRDIKAVADEKHAYVTAGLNGLFVFDIKEPAKPNQLAYLELPETVSLVGMCGSYLYLPVQNSLYIVDAANPLKPACVQKISVNSIELPVNLTVDSNRMYLVYAKSIAVYSLTDPLKPQFLTSFCPDNADETFIISDIAVRNGTAFIACEQKGIGIYNFSDIEKIEHKAVYNSPDGYCTSVDFNGNYAFLSIAGKNEMELLDISNIEKPVHSKTIKSTRSMLCVAGNTGYMVNDLGCLSIIDLSQYLLPADVKKENTAKPEVKNQKTAYITIDDGPSSKITPMNLDTLKKYGIKATFFVLPRSGVDDIYKRILDEGHVIGNHSYSHDYNYLYHSTEDFKKDVLKARDFIYKKLQYISTVFRFPGGSMGHKESVIKERAENLAELGYRYFDWDVTTADTDPNLKKYGTEDYIVNLLANNVIKGAKDRKKLIILMHDSSDKIYSAKALPKIIEGLQKQGYAFDVLTNY